MGRKSRSKRMRKVLRPASAAAAQASAGRRAQVRSTAKAKVMKLLEGYGRRAQFSVFECHVAPEEMQRLEQRLLGVIDQGQDDVRIYVCCDACARKARMLGKAERYRAPDFLIV